MIELKTVSDFAKYFKGNNFFTPVLVGYFETVKYVVEVSRCGNMEREVNGFGFKGTYGVTVRTLKGDTTNLSKLVDSYKELEEYLEELK